MIKTIDEAVAELKRDPGHAVTAEVDGLVVEMRYKGRRSAADVFRELGPWKGESTEEMQAFFRESRRQGGSGEPPTF